MANSSSFGRYKVEIVQASKKQQVNWWGFSFELYVLITEEYTKEILESIELPEEKKQF